MNKKALIADVAIWMIVAFITVMFLAMWKFGFNELTNAVTGLGMSGNVNLSNAAALTIQKANDAMPLLRFIALGIIFGMIVGMFILNYYVKSHPILLVVYVLFTVVAVVASIPIANEYETLMAHSTIGPDLTSFVGGSYILLHLPLFVGIIGIIGAILLFINVQKDPGMGSGGL